MPEAIGVLPEMPKLTPLDRGSQYHHLKPIADKLSVLSESKNTIADKTDKLSESDKTLIK